MTIDEAIKHCLKEASENDSQAAEYNEHDEWEFVNKCNCEQRAADHRQLAEWLTELKDLREENKDWKEEYAYINKLSYGYYKELKEAKRLLKLAVEDLSNTAAEAYNGRVICKCCKWLTETVYCKCPNDGGCDITYQWRYADEAFKIIGEANGEEKEDNK